MLNSYKLLKKLCVGAFFLAASQGAVAQQALLDEDFSGFPTGSPALPYQGWVNNIISGQNSIDQWIFDNPASRSPSTPISSPFAVFDSDWNSGGSTGAENVAMESPSFSTAGFGKITLQWDQYFNGIYNSTDSIVVEVFDGSTWVRVYSYNGYNSITNSQNIDVSTTLNNVTNAKVRFRFVGDWSWYWIVDNIKVNGYFTEDATTLKAEFTSGNCGSTDDSISVDIANGGLNAISNFDVKVTVTGTLGGNSVNISNTVTYSGTLASGAKANIMFPGINTASGGVVDLKAWTELSGEQNPANDTIKHASLNFLGIPATPGVSNQQRCGEGSVNLQATGVASGDSVIWFNSTGDKQLGVGTSFATPVTGPGTYTYSVAAARGAGSGTLPTTYAAGNGQSGVMFDVTPFKNISIDSFEVSFDAGTEVVEVYVKEGSYVGYETNAGAWTLVGSQTVTSTLSNGGPGIYVNVGQSIQMEVGKTYALYIQLPNNTLINYTNGANVYSNPDLQINAGVGCAQNFGGTFVPRTFNGALHYSYLACLSPKATVQVKVDPLPAGSDILKGTTFNGTFSVGDKTNPHIVADGDQIVFELKPPSNSSNTGFGTDWIISDLQITTLGGAAIPTGDTSTTLPGTSNATLSLTPSISISDSVLKMTTMVRSLQTGCDTVLTEYIYVAPRPVASFAFGAVCDGDALTFANNTTILSGVLSYEWDFGDGTTSVDKDPSHVFPADGSYTVTLKATSTYGYVDMSTQTVVVKKVPEADFSFLNACEGDPITFTNTTLMPAGTPAFHWDFGDGNTDMNQNTSHVFANPGYYPVVFVVDVNGCSDTMIKGVTQSARAVVDFNFTSSCNNSEAVFNNQSTLSFGLMGFQWKFGDGYSSTAKDPVHDYTGFGNFDVTLVVTTDGNCADSLTKSVSLIQAPEITISYNAPCVGDEMQFMNNSVVPSGGNNTYDWDFGDGTSSTDDSPSHTYPGVGRYPLVLKSFNPNGCSDSFFTWITVNEKPIAGIVVPDVVCDGSTVYFLNSTGASKPSELVYSWDFGNGVTSNAKDTSLVYAGPGSYDVTMIASMPGGCSDTIGYPVRVSAIPQAGYTFSSAEKGDGSIQFLADNTGSGLSYQWFFGDGGKATTYDPEYMYRFDGIYTVRLIVTNADNCFSETTQSVKVYRTGVENPEDGGLTIYPNPNHGRFTVELEGGNAASYGFRVLNGLGQEVEVQSQITGDKQVSFDLHGVSAGVYFLMLTDADGNSHSLRFTVN